ncbi:hypothetical protein IM793_01105 [Pedobacter sp. MR2016-19]|uniref:hypothetical protein n=1 Tax=Pedobacter sp. MR2016-19 TaxID=2780089 RepID=UPI001876ABCA|nr:hypothetical protein [Pedobacter sp. MR2016-19]MBE5317742.1 hypothetical protein [Pedobacter sp. MR2016-19]
MNNKGKASNPDSNELKGSEKFNQRVLTQYLLIKKQNFDGNKIKSSPVLITSNAVFVVVFLFIFSVSLFIINDMLLFALGAAIILLVWLAYFLLAEYFLRK